MLAGLQLAAVPQSLPVFCQVIIVGNPLCGMRQNIPSATAIIFARCIPLPPILVINVKSLLVMLPFIKISPARQSQDYQRKL